MHKKAKLLAILPAFWTCLFDTVITILHQSNEYWEGNLNTANEGNPIGNFFMSHHVSGLFLISAFWLILIVVLGYYLPRKVARVFLLFTFIAHSWGASTWLSRYGFWYVIIFIAINSILFYVVEDGIHRENSLHRS